MRHKTTPTTKSITKSPTGIRGLDEITGGGLPTGRPTLVCGNAGCGKTLLAMQFLVHGAVSCDEPGVFMAFEETVTDLVENVRSLGFDLESLIRRRKLAIDYVHIERSEIQETGEYDLEGLFIRLKHAIDSVGAKRVVLDTIEALFGGLPNDAILRAELWRLFRWLKTEGVTAVITGERGEKELTRHGMEEYVSDCVIVLDHRVVDQTSTRRLRVGKYRGSVHGTNEYPFLIDRDGIGVLPVTSLGLNYPSSSVRVGTGIPRLDMMLGRDGYYRGSSVLVSGTAGSGKTSVAAHFAQATCERGERCLYFLFEESPDQMTRNMRSIGLDLNQWVKKGLLELHAARPTAHGLEMHLATSHRAIERFEPAVVIIDPITSFSTGGNDIEVRTMLVRLIDHLKGLGVTTLLVSLAVAGRALGHTDSQISSLIDTWLLLRDIEQSSERRHVLQILKSRGMPHSNQMREFRLTGQGIELLDVGVGSGGATGERSRPSDEAAPRRLNQASGTGVHP